MKKNGWKEKIVRKAGRGFFAAVIFTLLFALCVPGSQTDVEGTDDVRVRFGLSDPAYAVYQAESTDTGIQYTAQARQGQYISSPMGWVVQDDYSTGGVLADETALLNYINSPGRELGGTTVTLLRVEEDGYIYDDGISYLSVLGDSISTLSGVTDIGGYNSQTHGNAARYLNAEGNENETGATLLISRSETWWDQAAVKSGHTLLVNSSARGTMAAGGIKRCRQLAADRDVEGETHRNTAPDTIVIYLGTNDYRKSDLTASEFYKNYRRLLERMSEIYTHAQIYCVNITDCYTPSLSEEQHIDLEPGISLEHWDGTSYRLQHFNRQIALAVENVNQELGGQRIHLVELYNQNKRMMMTLDLANDEDMTESRAVNYGTGRTWLSLHPSAAGHKIIADAVLEVLGGGTVPKEEGFTGDGVYGLEELPDGEESQAEGQEEVQEGSRKEGAWRIDTREAVFSTDGSEIYLDQWTPSGDTVLERLQIPVICVSKDILDGDTEEMHLWLTVEAADGEETGEVLEIELPKHRLLTAFLRNFHREGSAVSNLAGLDGTILSWKRGGRITEGIYKDCCYIGAYIEIPVSISLEENQTVRLCKDQTAKILIDSNLGDLSE